ncbi:MAG: hypothetical protein RM338_28430 [Nostoc sp. DedQUE12a]|nr:hypothetical protein [Nostoc sp. DedQUE12a]
MAKSTISSINQLYQDILAMNFRVKRWRSPPQASLFDAIFED